MITKRGQHALWIVCTALAGGGPGLADTVVLQGKPPFDNVQIINFTRGKLVFRGVCQELLRKPLGEVVRFQIDRNPMLSNAEALGWANAEPAITAYRQALADAAEPWLRDLIRVRLLSACDHAGRFDQAVALYVKLLREDPAAVRQFAPRHPGARRSEGNRRAREHLLAALQTARSPVADRALRTLTLELLLFDEVEPLPAGFEPPGPQPAADHAAPATSPDGLPPPLFGPARRHTRGQAPQGAEGARHAAEPLRLPVDSFVLTGAREAFEAGDASRAARLLERALPYLHKADCGAWRLLLGRCRIELGAFARAADELLALSESTTDERLAAEALYYVAVAHERMDRADVAARLYQELSQRGGVPPEIRQRARRGLERLGE